MPFTLVAFDESQDSATLANIAACADPHVRVVGDDIYVPPAWPHLAGYYFLGVAFTQGQVLSPTLRRICNLDVEPGDRSAEPSSPPPFHDLFANPIPLEGGEAINCAAAEDGANGQYSNALLFLSDGPLTPVTGPIFTIRATNASTLTARAWTNGALTFSQTLPRGTYQVVGMRAQSAGLIAARLVFPGLSQRPGCIGFDADGDLEPQRFRKGNAGVWGEFVHDAPPTVDFLSVSADSSQVVHLDLIKIA